jgi:hypothetical protein
MSRWLTGYDKAVNGGVSQHTLPLLVCCGIEHDSGEAHAGSEEQACAPDNQDSGEAHAGSEEQACEPDNHDSGEAHAGSEEQACEPDNKI